MNFLERTGEPRLAWRLDVPEGSPRGAVLATHGFAEHSGRYDHVAAGWVERGLVVARYDLRGHGVSSGPRGHIQSFDEYLRDVDAMLGALQGEAIWRAAGRPSLFGHSLGGLVATYAAARLGSRIAGLALTSPFFGLALKISAVESALASVASRLAPGLRQPSRLSGTVLTHDVDRARAYDADPLHFSHVTTRWFTEVQKAQTDITAHARAVRAPVYCIAAGDDRVVSLAATARVFDAFETEKELDVRPGLFHEVLNELDSASHVARLAERMIRWGTAS